MLCGKSDPETSQNTAPPCYKETQPRQRLLDCEENPRGCIARETHIGCQTPATSFLSDRHSSIPSAQVSFRTMSPPPAPLLDSPSKWSPLPRTRRSSSSFLRSLKEGPRLDIHDLAVSHIELALQHLDELSHPSGRAARDVADLIVLRSQQTQMLLAFLRRPDPDGDLAYPARDKRSFLVELEGREWRTRLRARSRLCEEDRRNTLYFALSEQAFAFLESCLLHTAM